MSKFNLKPSFFILTRNLSKSLAHCSRKKYIKYPNIYEEHIKSERTDSQRLINSGRKLAPYDKRFPVTGKGTGPAVEGGSEEALELASLHLVPPTGFVNRKGQFIREKNMVARFVVPDLKDFHLKPYVPYGNVPDIERDEHTARDLFDACYADAIKNDFYAGIEEEHPKKKT